MPHVPRVAPSALGHDLTRAEILAAYAKPLHSWDLGDGLTMVLGHHGAAVILERARTNGNAPPENDDNDDNGEMVIIHATRAWQKFVPDGASPLEP